MVIFKVYYGNISSIVFISCPSLRTCSENLDLPSSYQKSFLCSLNLVLEFQPRAYVIKKHDGTIVADTTSILSRWKQFFSNLLNVNQSTSHEGSEVYTAEPDIPEPSLIKVDLAIEKLKRHKAT